MDHAYVDTSAWVSLADSSEASHERVAETMQERRGRLVTADHVLHEVWAVMRYRHGFREAETLVNAIRGGIARIEVSGPTGPRGCRRDQVWHSPTRTSRCPTGRVGP